MEKECDVSATLATTDPFRIWNLWKSAPQYPWIQKICYDRERTPLANRLDRPSCFLTMIIKHSRHSEKIIIKAYLIKWFIIIIIIIFIIIIIKPTTSNILKLRVKNYRFSLLLAWYPILTGTTFIIMFNNNNNNNKKKNLDYLPIGGVDVANFVDFFSCIITKIVQRERERVYYINFIYITVNIVKNDE